MKLNPWRLLGLLTFTRTRGQVGLRKNGSMLDVWVRVDGTPRWIALSRRDVQDFLASDDVERVLYAESDGNAEETWREAAARMESREVGTEPAS